MSLLQPGATLRRWVPPIALLCIWSRLVYLCKLVLDKNLRKHYTETPLVLITELTQYRAQTWTQTFLLCSLIFCPMHPTTFQLVLGSDEMSSSLSGTYMASHVSLYFLLSCLLKTAFSISYQPIDWSLTQTFIFCFPPFKVCICLPLGLKICNWWKSSQIFALNTTLFYFVHAWMYTLKGKQLEWYVGLCRHYRSIMLLYWTLDHSLTFQLELGVKTVFESNFAS